MTVVLLLLVTVLGAPSLLVLKSDVPSRFCNDYCKVIAITKPNLFPLPRMDDCVGRVGAAKYVVTKLDLLKGYWQVPRCNIYLNDIVIY